MRLRYISRLTARPRGHDAQGVFMPATIVSHQLSLRPHRWDKLSQRVLAAAVVAGALCGIGFTSSAAADTCPNAELRAENNSLALPECRAYEMATPSSKQGFVTYLQTFSDDGTVHFWSSGNLAGNGAGYIVNQYLAKRSASGWVTSALNPPMTTYAAYPGLDGEFGAGVMSDDDRSLWAMRPLDHLGVGLYVRRSDGVFTRIGDGFGGLPYTKLVTPDLSHVVFGESNVSLAPLWEYVGTDNDGPPREVSVDNNGLALPVPTRPGDEVRACGDAISTDGRVITFTAPCDGAGAGVQSIWARVGGAASILVSRSECTRTASEPGGTCKEPAAAEYAGAATDGSRVFFTTTQQLVNGDTNQSKDLYACDIPAGVPAPVGASNSCATLTQVSGTGSEAQVDHVVAVSDDGSRVYFVAGGVLASNLGVTDSVAVAGQSNLYLWSKDAAHPTGTTTFVAPTAVGTAQITPDGRYIVFDTSSQLVSGGPGADTDGAIDMYRYDAVSKTIARLSTSTSGDGGNNDTFDAQIDTSAAHNSNSRALYRADTIVTADGSTVAFVTNEALSPSDTNSGTDVYEWHEGQVSLISGVGGGRAPWITASGRDLFFVTTQQLTSSDGDTVDDLYDARVGGGLDVSQKPPCSGEGCRGPDSATPNLPTSPPRTPTADTRPELTPALSLHAISARQRKTLIRTGKITLRVTTNAAGTLTVTATSTLAAKATTIATSRKSVATPATTPVALTFAKRARAQLAKRGRLTVTITVRHSKIALARTTTLKLVKPKH
jgi:hypothetical protein